MAKPKAVKATHGEKMIEVKLRFWTNDIAAKGKILPKHARTSGMVYMVGNESHGIAEGGKVPFRSLLEISAAVQKALMKNGIVLHPSRVDARYLKA